MFRQPTVQSSKFIPSILDWECTHLFARRSSVTNCFSILSKQNERKFAVGRPFYRSRRRRVTLSWKVRAMRNPFIGGTRLGWFRVRKTLLARTGSLRCARDYPRADNRLYRFIAGALCSRQWNKSRPFKSKVLSRCEPPQGIPFEIASCEKQDQTSFDMKFFDAAVNPAIKLR